MDIEEIEWRGLMDTKEVDKIRLKEKENLVLLNSMKVIDWDSFDGEMQYILVEDNKENRDILCKIGMTNEEIEDDCFPNDKCLDLIDVGFKYAEYFDSDCGFC